MCLFLCRTQPLWHKQFAVTYIQKLTDSLLKVLCFVGKPATDSTNTAVKGILQEESFEIRALEQLIDSFVDPIWRRFYTLEMISKIQCVYRLHIGRSLMSLSNLKKRIQGIKYVNEAIRSVRQAYQQHRLMTSKELIQKLRELDVMEQLFGEGTHYQLVHRSQDLVRLLFNEKEIRESEIDMIWNVCVKQGQQIKLEIYKIVLEVLRAAYSCMTDETKEHFIDKIATMQPALLIDKDIEIVIELGKKGGVSFRQPEPFVQKAAQLLWSISVLEKPYPLSTTKTARKKFCEQVQSWDDGYKEPYIAQCLDNISNNKYPLQNLKIAMKLMEKMNTNAYGAQPNKRTRQEFAQDLIQTQDLDSMIIRDLDQYVQHANAACKRGELTAANLKTQELGDNHPFPHIKNLKSRLKRLTSLLQFAKAKLKPA